MPAAARRALALIAVLLCLLYAALMFYGSWTLIVQLRLFGSVAHDIPLPRWVLLSSLPIGFALLGLRIFQVLVGVIRGTSEGLGHAPDQAPTLIDGEDRAR